MDNENSSNAYLSHLAYLNCNRDDRDEDNTAGKVVILIHEPKKAAENLEYVKRVENLQKQTPVNHIMHFASNCFLSSRLLHHNRVILSQFQTATVQHGSFAAVAPSHWNGSSP